MDIFSSLNISSDKPPVDKSAADLPSAFNFMSSMPDQKVDDVQKTFDPFEDLSRVASKSSLHTMDKSDDLSR